MSPSRRRPHDPPPPHPGRLSAPGPTWRQSGWGRTRAQTRVGWQSGQAAARPSAAASAAAAAWTLQPAPLIAHPKPCCSRRAQGRAAGGAHPAPPAGAAVSRLLPSLLPLWCTCTAAGRSSNATSASPTVPSACLPFTPAHSDSPFLHDRHHGGGFVSDDDRVSLQSLLFAAPTSRGWCRAHQEAWACLPCDAVQRTIAS